MLSRGCGNSQGAASAPAVGPAGLDDKSAGKGKTKPAAPAEKVVVDPLALKTKEDPQPPKNSVVSEIPSSLTPNKQSNSACPPGFVKSLVSGGKISITCKVPSRSHPHPRKAAGQRYLCCPPIDSSTCRWCIVDKNATCALEPRR